MIKLEQYETLYDEEIPCSIFEITKVSENCNIKRTTISSLAKHSLLMYIKNDCSIDLFFDDGKYRVRVYLQLYSYEEFFIKEGKRMWELFILDLGDMDD